MEVILWRDEVFPGFFDLGKWDLDQDHQLMREVPLEELSLAFEPEPKFGDNTRDTLVISE